MLLSKMTTGAHSESQTWKKMAAEHDIDAVVVPQIPKPNDWVLVICRDEKVLEDIQKINSAKASMTFIQELITANIRIRFDLKPRMPL